MTITNDGKYTDFTHAKPLNWSFLKWSWGVLCLLLLPWPGRWACRGWSHRGWWGDSWSRCSGCRSPSWLAAESGPSPRHRTVTRPHTCRSLHRETSRGSPKENNKSFQFNEYEYVTSWSSYAACSCMPHTCCNSQAEQQASSAALWGGS